MTQPFHFPNGRAANDAQDLLELCQQYPDEATGFLVRHDLENWLAYIGSYDVAECAANARQIEGEDRQKLEDFLNKCHSLTATEPVPIAVTSTDIQENLTTPDQATVTETEVATVSETPFQGVSVQETPVKETPVKETPVKETPVKEAPVEKAMPAQPSTTAVKSAVKPDQATSASSSSTNSSEKPSFFQVVAKFIVKILYRNKA